MRANHPELKQLSVIELELSAERDGPVPKSVRIARPARYDSPVFGNREVKG